MTTALLNPKGKNKKEREALEVAEESREKEWSNPSFVAEIFMGRLRTKMVIPYPEQPEKDKKIGDEYLFKVEKFIREKLNPEEIDAQDEIPSTYSKFV